MDRGEYAGSWETAGQYFRDQLSEVQWIEALESVRLPLGDLNDRTLQSSNFRERLPSASDGAYHILIFESAFENLPSAIETVTLMQESDGQ